MIISRLISEYSQYSITQDYIRGVLVEITGIVIEVLLLSITVPIVLYFVSRVRTRQIRSMADFYLFQIFHNITRMFLDMASISDISPILEEEQKKDSKFKIYSNFSYGNLENILFVLNKKFNEGDSFRIEIEKKSLADFETYLKTAEQALNEIDRLAAMLVSVPDTQKDIFNMRILFYPLRDVFEQVIEDLQESGKENFSKDLHLYCVQSQTEDITKTIDCIFSKRRKLIDSRMKNKYWISIIKLFLSLPYVLARRFLSLYLCRVRKKPYRDFLYPSNSPDILRDWRVERGLSIESAATLLGISPKSYRDLEYGYREPKEKVWEAFYCSRKDRSGSKT